MVCVRDHKTFVSEWALSSESLMRPPRGYSAEHPAIEDLKRKDFVGVASIPRSEVIGSKLVKLAGDQFAAAVPFMKFLCERWARSIEGFQYWVPLCHCDW